jgi:2,6-dihydroxypyridine 3-monooxygenase
MSDYSTATAIVVGGSIGGLTAALLLRDLGFNVDVYERTPTPLEGSGSGIVLQPDTVRWFVENSTQDLADLRTSTSYVQYLDRDGDIVQSDKTTWTYTSWGTFYRALLADFGTDHYHYGEYACGFSQDHDVVTVRFVSGATASADLVVFADGIRSVVRERFDPNGTFSYAGYIGWRGTLPLSGLSAHTRDTLQDAVTYNVIPNSHILMYPIPGEEDLGPQHRLMNYVWYRNVPAGPDLTEMLIDKRGLAGVVSVHPGQVQDRYITQMRQDAAELLAPAVAEVVLATKNLICKLFTTFGPLEWRRAGSPSSATPPAPRDRMRPREPQRLPQMAGHWPRHCAIPAATFHQPSPSGSRHNCNSATTWSDASSTWASVHSSATAGYRETPICDSGSTVRADRTTALERKVQ